MAKTIEKWMKDCILPFSKKDKLRITKNYRHNTLTLKTVKVSDTLLFNPIQPEIDNILWKVKFHRN